MKRTTISLPDDLAGALSREARRRNSSVSQLTRDALVSHLGLTPGAPRALPFAELGGSGERSTARDMEGLIAREWDDPARSR